ncbi:hypothetical protein MUDAN_DOGOELCO_02732 [Lactiplantibacillus mudanjiangensis]|uniref:Uncharacterized protein n=1 Tax=Lactiplantibacillus mudanjiangensis TaxID=1296538 RepID=A0A660ECL1_9LACO|nr:hypothetical protein MUDAN_IGPPGNFN_00748 [Lactiplantibacillus mudanjiangensis]VDG30311.1 hypothetical protein MUDAN_MDHGFNIF_01862 [Lactiplantibacillus mudanjiangensis]VDG33568.1 hypothetical protein MUDAN_DOGOELCO_02732 [Lactiplantibacillus mudanjiangensis]
MKLKPLTQTATTAGLLIVAIMSLVKLAKTLK